MRVDLRLLVNPHDINTATYLSSPLYVQKAYTTQVNLHYVPLSAPRNTNIKKFNFTHLFMFSKESMPALQLPRTVRISHELHFKFVLLSLSKLATRESKCHNFCTYFKLRQCNPSPNCAILTRMLPNFNSTAT